MSLPLTRRIARAALLIAAGAAPVVGAAGSASAVDLEQANPVGSSLSSLDTASVSDTVTGATENPAGLAETGGKTVEQAAPALQRAAANPGGGAQDVLGGAAGGVTEQLGGGTGLPTDQLGEAVQTSPLGDKLPLGTGPLPLG
ncbi:ATP-binding protein [Streptomyces sp. NPDC055078]